MLKADSLSKSFKKNRTILENLSFTAEGGHIYGVMGESGSGKSTFLAIIAGLLKPDKGQVEINGEDLYQLDEARYLEIRRNTISYIPQSNVLLKNYTVLENILLPYVFSGKCDEESLKERALYYLKELQISHLAESYPYEISGGEAKRVSIIRAMVTDPLVVIADEPTTGLDRNTGKIIFDFLQKYVSDGNTLIVATHDEQIKNYTDNILFLERKR